MFLELLRNAAMLMAFCMTYALLFRSHNRNSVSGRLILGIIFGLAAVFAMLNPTALFPGILIDSRTIFISMAGLLGGGVSVLFASLIALACRAILGGAGAPVGYAIIVTSALLGLGGRYFHHKKKVRITKSSLYVFGLIVHVDMLLLMFALPVDIRWKIIETVTLPVLLIYPIGTVLVGRLLLGENERTDAEQALRESEGNLAITLNSIGDGVVVTDLEGRIVRLNPVAEKLTGWTSAEAMGRSAEEVFHIVNVETRQRVENPGKRVLEKGRIVGLANHTVLISRDGTEWHIADSASPIYNSEGEVTGAVLVFRDVTRRQAAEKALVESNRRLESILQVVPIGIGRMKNQVFKDVNPYVCKLTGYNQEELTGQSSRMLYLTEEDFLWVGKEKDRQINEKGTGTVETKWVCKDGRVLDVLLSSTPMNADDPSAGSTFAVLDITARKKAEEQSVRLMLAIEQSTEIVMITDAEANIQYLNPAFEKVTGYCREEAVGQNPRILQSGQHAPSFYRKMWDTLTAGNPWLGQLINKKKDGTIYTEEASISPVTGGNGKIVNYVGVKRDATHELELEDQLRQAQKMEAVGQLAGGIAHDFNNLLQVISGYAELTQMDVKQGDPLAPAIDEIITAAHRGKALINQLLAFSRRQVIQPVDLNLNDLIGPLLQMMRGLIGEHIELDFIAGHELSTIHADRGLMEQVLMNLCVNARDAMSKGGKLTIETENILIDDDYARSHSWATRRRYVLLSVTDTGCGMDSRTLRHIFEPFFTTKEVGKGTGLGLSTVFGIVKQHDGHVNVYSEQDKGTIFKIYLPSVERNATEVSRKPRGPVIGGTETILIAEDDEAVLALAEHLLIDAGYTVLTAVDGEDAIRVFEEHIDEIDAVVFDVVMPRLGGKQAMGRILELRPGLPHLFASGYSENAVHTNFIQKRGLHLLSKPYQTETLLRKIREVLDEK